jgi:hypothetical protein
LGVVFRPIPHYIYFKISQTLFTNKSRIGFLAGTLFTLNRVFITPMYWILDNNELFLCIFVCLSIQTCRLSETHENV